MLTYHQWGPVTFRALKSNWKLISFKISREQWVNTNNAFSDKHVLYCRWHFLSTYHKSIFLLLLISWQNHGNNSHGITAFSWNIMVSAPKGLNLTIKNLPCLSYPVGPSFFDKISTTICFFAPLAGSLHPYHSSHRADSRLAPSQWETPLQSNGVSHWLGANLESALSYHVGLSYMCCGVYHQPKRVVIHTTAHVPTFYPQPQITFQQTMWLHDN